MIRNWKEAFWLIASVVGVSIIIFGIVMMINTIDDEATEPTCTTMITTKEITGPGKTLTHVMEMVGTCPDEGVGVSYGEVQ